MASSWRIERLLKSINVVTYKRCVARPTNPAFIDEA
jgi:hypothetical protein